MSELLESFLLVAALSVDALIASFSYGVNKIRIPFLSVLTISGVCSAILAVSLLLGSVLRPFLPPGLTKILCFVILFLLGSIKLYDSAIKSYIRKHQPINREITFSLFHLQFMLTIYANPEEADRDASKVLSPLEAAPLAVALSLDGLAAGFGAALAGTSVCQVLILSLLFGCFAVKLGCLIGNKVAEKLPLDLSWIGGLILILLAFCKL